MRFPRHFQDISEMSKKCPEKFQETPGNSKPFQHIPRNSREFQGFHAPAVVCRFDQAMMSRHGFELLAMDADSERVRSLFRKP